MNLIKIAIGAMICGFALGLCSIASGQEKEFSPFDLGRLHGVALPKQEVKLAAPIDGVVFKILVREGQLIEENDLILMMDNRLSHESYKSAEMAARHSAMARHAEAALKLAKSNHRRMMEAFQNDASTEVELEESKIKLEQAQAQFESELEKQELAKQTLEMKKVELEQHNLRAPFSGRVIRVETKPGQTVGKVEPIISLASLKTLSVELNLPLEYFGKLRAGEAYQLTAGTPVSKNISGRLVSIDPIIDSASETFRCSFEIENTDESLPAGFTVDLNIETLKALRTADNVGRP